MQAMSEKHLKGIDVSHWQGMIDWKKVRAAGIDFVFIKATEGKTVVDPNFERNARDAARAGLNVGFYHFARFASEADAVKEADHYLQTICGFRPVLPHVLDLETAQGLDKARLSACARVYLDRVAAGTGEEVMIYTNTNFAKRHLTEALRNVPLWIAHYGVRRPGENGIWKEWRVFQYSNEGRLPGIKGRVDLNVRVPEEETKRREADAKRDQTAKTSDKGSYLVYKVKKGDTLWALENRFGLAHGTLLKMNPGIRPEALRIGQSLRVPAAAYVIKKGDTFWRLEEENGWRHGVLQQMNPDADPERLGIGQTIAVPPR
ncbi:GH25 family lysozyme [Caenibacillus caldisaponilyticus]|uniref:GH25 family lysozyme n=1 Tax=Caenibacillus caldisaponilyticus TaxID=1674942 RepID=UPI00130127A2|nr:GH25 family lysozyme [Caenibacillus caldisaponilyticus]